jgi:hypothetical protein
MMTETLPEDYRCPFCPNHVDGEFVWHELAQTCVCLGCQAEIDYGFDTEEQPTLEDYNCADTIERLLTHLGIDYAEARRRHCSLVASGSLDGRYIVVRV